MTDIDDLDDCPEPWRSEIERLREENERLRKASWFMSVSLVNILEDDDAIGRLRTYAETGLSWSDYDHWLIAAELEEARAALVTANTPANTADAATDKTDAKP